MAANEGTGDAKYLLNRLPADVKLEEKASAVYFYSNYQAQSWHGNSLSEYFADNFREFSVEDLMAVDSDTRPNLLDLLRKREL